IVHLLMYKNKKMGIFMRKSKLTTTLKKLIFEITSELEKLPSQDYYSNYIKNLYPGSIENPMNINSRKDYLYKS
ncbi:MAG: hypothetical protein K2I72_03020, partial [Bacilli bacterium]|nr:hypothetical protein [Bacilli bacterium]